VVGPSITPEERDVANLRLKVGFVLLVAASAGLVAVQAEASLLQLAGAVAVGAAVGLALLAFMIRWSRQMRESGPGRQRP
jgi:ammonia channel protein AmtB